MNTTFLVQCYHILVQFDNNSQNVSQNNSLLKDSIRLPLINSFYGIVCGLLPYLLRFFLPRESVRYRTGAIQSVTVTFHCGHSPGIRPLHSCDDIAAALLHMVGSSTYCLASRRLLQGQTSRTQAGASYLIVIVNIINCPLRLVLYTHYKRHVAW